MNIFDLESDRIGIGVQTFWNPTLQVIFNSRYFSHVYLIQSYSTLLLEKQLIDNKK